MNSLLKRKRKPFRRGNSFIPISRLNTLIKRIDERIVSISIFFVSLFTLALGFKTIFSIMHLIEFRSGALLYGPIHQLLPPPIDLSVWVFAVIYFCGLWTIIDCFLTGLPRISRAFFGYSILLFLRSIVIYLIPLDPPQDMVLLIDPAIIFMGSQDIMYTKDLFFSGHTASMTFFYFMIKTKWKRRIFSVAGIFIFGTLIFQRAYYSIDILGGVFAGWFAYWLIHRLEPKVIS